MSFKKTLLFFLIFAFLGVYYYLEVKKTEKTKEIEIEEKRVFFPIIKEDISEITIIKEGQEKIRVTRENGGWKIKEPVEAGIDEDSFTIWFDYVVNLSKERIVAESVADKSEFGLDKPTFSVQVRPADGAILSIELGDEIPTGSMFYSKLKNKDPVFLIAAYNKNGIDKTPYQLRNKNIFHFEKDDVKGIKVETPEGNYYVEKKGDGWSLVKPKIAQADAEKIASLLEKTKTTNIKKFIDKPGEDMALYGLEYPKAKTTFFVGKDMSPNILFLGKASMEDEGAYAKTGFNNKTLVLENKYIQEFPYRTKDIRDKSILKFEDERVIKIQLIYQDKTITLSRDKEKKWRIIAPKKFKADDFSVNALLKDIKKAEIIDFIPASLEQENFFALKYPTLTVKVFEKNIEAPKIISFGSEFKAMNAVYANNGNPDEVILLSKELFNKLSRNEISLRNKYLLALDETKIARMQIEYAGKEYILTISNDIWALEKPEEKMLDTIKAKEILWSLGDIKFIDIIDEEGAQDSKLFGLRHPFIKVNLQDSEGRDLESIHVGSEIGAKNLLYAITDKSKTIYSIDSEFKYQLLNSLNNLLESKGK